MIVGLVGPIVCIVLSRTDRSIGDVALIELRTRDVLSAHPPLTGAYSRYGWSHPGPLPFYVFALPFRLLGNDSDALRLTALLFNLVVIVIICWLVARRGHAPLAFVAATTIALVWGLQPHSLSDAWNVTVAILPFLLTIVACWCALCGDRWALLVAALSFSFVFQAHTGFGLVLVPLMAFTLLSRGLAALRSSRTIDRRVLLATAAVVVAFVPVLYDMAAHWPGNLGRLAKWSLRNDEPKVGFGDGLRVVGRATSLSFLTHPQVPGRFLLTIDTISTGIAPGIAVVLLLMACAITIRRRLPAERSLCICLLLVWAAGSFAAANITEPLL
ncbi:MAG: hypothetical protein JWN99_1503, partial [Ilumatobacteraceae bacterium]|nr:hypothetical protein [Ilumatobacteraceae bacterium]